MTVVAPKHLTSDQYSETIDLSFSIYSFVYSFFPLTAGRRDEDKKWNENLRSTVKYMFFLDQAYSSKWPDVNVVLFLRFLCTSNSSRSIKTQQKNSANNQPSWPHAWSIRHINIFHADPYMYFCNCYFTLQTIFAIVIKTWVKSIETEFTKHRYLDQCCVTSNSLRDGIVLWELQEQKC